MTCGTGTSGINTLVVLIQVTTGIVTYGILTLGTLTSGSETDGMSMLIMLLLLLPPRRPADKVLHTFRSRARD